MRRLIFVDGDIILHKACHAAEMEIYWGEGDWTLSLNEEQAKTIAREMLEDIRLACSAKKSTIRMCFSNGKSFRKEIYPDYKANRKNQRKPLGMKAMKRWLSHEYKTIQYDYLEADDVMGIHMTKPGKQIKIGVSIDKDMKTIPGTHYNPDTGESFEITEAEADYHFYKQVLTGDSTDNYPGCPGVGPKTAEKILSQCDPDEYKNAVCETYRKNNVDNQLQMARLARILRWEDFDFPTKSPLLFNFDGTRTFRTPAL